MNRVNEYLQKLTDFVAAVVGLLLGLRFFLRLFGANSGNGFVSWIYDTSAPILAPFENIFTPARLNDGFVLELSTLFAILVYGLAASLLIYLLGITGPTNTSKKR